MRTFPSLLALCALALSVAACSSTTSPTTNDTLGKTSIEEIEQNTAYSWYSVGYDAFPGPSAADQARFAASVATIRANFDSSKHSIVMALKLSCGCAETQNTLPQVMKTLDEAGVPRSSIGIYATDTRLNGIDSIKAKYNIGGAPVYIILKNDVVKGEILKAPSTGKTVDQDLADMFAQP